MRTEIEPCKIVVIGLAFFVFAFVVVKALLILSNERGSRRSIAERDCQGFDAQNNTGNDQKKERAR